MTYAAKIIADSVNSNGVRLTTMEITYPRFVHCEFMTHRVFSRNAASSRAIPVAKMMQRVEEDPVWPVWWGKNQAGMQAEEELTAVEQSEAKAYWLDARDAALHHARRLVALGVHKQIVNRILEPWCWITVIVSATDWQNFFGLRCHPAAQPELRVIADKMFDLYLRSQPHHLEDGEWHIPYLEDRDQIVMKDWLRVSTGRCARVSYLNHDGKRDPAADIALHDRLAAQTPGHWSPFEHVAQARSDIVRARNFRGFLQYRAVMDKTSVEQ